jgi:hypothetical protein
MNPHQTEHTRRWCRGRAGGTKSPARLAWERIKAQAGRQTRRRRQAERLAAAPNLQPEVA